MLKRKTPGKKIDFQLIAANIDIAFIVQSLDNNFNLRRLERYLVMINESNIKPIVLLSKSDLLTSKEVECRIGDIQQIMPRLHVQPFSNKNGSGLAIQNAVLVVLLFRFIPLILAMGVTKKGHRTVLTWVTPLCPSTLIPFCFVSGDA